MHQANNILIRLPNWLGDMVMSTAFVKALHQAFPHATIDLIAKKGIDSLLEFFPSHNHRYIFSKDEYEGLSGAWKFGKKIAAQKKYDLFFCLPDSFSSGIMGKAINARYRVGYKKELRSFLFTHSYQKKKNIHRVEEYIDLLQQYLDKKISIPTVSLTLNQVVNKEKKIVININSEASSRRLPKEKAIEIIDNIRKNITQEIILLGSSKEKEFVDNIFKDLANKDGISNLAGQTNLSQMIQLFSSCQLVLSTDSGPAHVANALGIHTVVLFGAGNENNTAPYNQDNRTIIRLGQLPCEPCTKNICKLYAAPECLLQLNENQITEKIYQLINK